MPRYSLCTLLILLAIGPPLGAWLVNAHRQVQERRPYFVRFNEDTFALRMAWVETEGEISEVSWIRRLMGDAAIATLLYQPSADKSGEQLERVRRLFPEAKIWGWPHDDDPLPAGVLRLPPNARIII